MDRYAHLKARTQDFALQTIKLVESLPRTWTADVIGTQLLRSATSVGEQIIERLVARNRLLILSRKWGSSKKRLTNAFIG